MEKARDKSIQETGTLVQRNSLKLIGIGGRTSNEKEFKGQGIIPVLWAQFIAERIADKIPNRTGNPEIIAAYYDIESDDRSPYSFFIGKEVSTFDEIPEGMVSLEVPEGRFLKVTTDKGSLQTVGIEAWMKIWESDSFRKERKFDVDLEVYGADSLDPENASFDIFMGLR